MMTSRIQERIASYPLYENKAGCLAQFSLNKNPPVGQFLDYLNNPAFVTNSDNWVDLNCSTIYQLLSKKIINLNDLVKNVGIENSFALLILCYRSASLNAENQVFPWCTIADYFGSLLEELAKERLEEYHLLNFSGLKFSKEQIDPAFLNKLAGIGEKERFCRLGTICKVALGALALGGLVFAASQSYFSIPSSSSTSFDGLSEKERTKFQLQLKEVCKEGVSNHYAHNSTIRMQDYIHPNWKPSILFESPAIICPIKLKAKDQINSYSCMELLDSKNGGFAHNFEEILGTLPDSLPVNWLSSLGKHKLAFKADQSGNPIKSNQIVFKSHVVCENLDGTVTTGNPIVDTLRQATKGWVENENADT